MELAPEAAEPVSADSTVDPTNSAASVTSDVAAMPVTHTFEHKGSVYVYDFELLTTQRVSSAEEVFEFKRQQIQSKPRKWEDILMTGGHVYFQKALAYLLVRKEGEEYKTEVSATVRDHAETFIANLPAKHYQQLRECCTDFFGRIGKSEFASSVFSRDEINIESLLSSWMGAKNTSGDNSK